MENGLFPSSYIAPSMARNGVVYPQPEAEASFSRKDFFINLQSFSAVSCSCVAHRSQSETRILSRVKIQLTVCDKPKLSYIAGEHGERSALPCPPLPLCHRNHSPADTPSPVCKRSVPQTASCPKLNPAFSHSIQKTNAVLKLLGQSSFLALILAAIHPDQSISFKTEVCVAQHMTALPSVLHAAELK